jgi:glycosidase
MQWDNSENAGFSNTKPWIRVNPDFPHRNATAQRKDPGSLLNFTRQLISLRRKLPALVSGNFCPLTSLPVGVLAYLRRSEEQTVLVALNFTGRKKIVTEIGVGWRIALSSSDPGTEAVCGSPFELEPYQILLAVNSHLDEI